jgi:hypothetical protein
LNKLETEVDRRLGTARVARGTHGEGESDVGSKDEERRREAGAILQRLGAWLPSAYEHLHIAFGEAAEQLAKLVALAEREKQANLLYHHQSLKWAEGKLLEMLDGLESRRKEIVARLDQARRDINDWVVRMRTVEKLALLPRHREDAVSLCARLEMLFTESSPDLLEDQFKKLRGEMTELWSSFEDAAKRQQERGAAMSIMRETLEEMGYQIVSLPDGGAPAAGHSLRLHLRTPDGEALEASFGLDRSVQFEFLHAAPESKHNSRDSSHGELLGRCRKWCNDRQRFIELVKAKGVALQDRWLVPAEAREFRALPLPGDVLEEPKRAKPLPRRRPEDRRRTIE